MSNNITIENARIIFRNFSGEERRFNPKGNRNFAVLLESKVASDLANDGWNVKILQPREEGEEPTPYLPVKINYKGRPPHVVMVSSRNRVDMKEEDIGILDYADLAHVDLVIRPYDWEVNGREGRTAYLKTGYFVIDEDPVELKYAMEEDADA